MATVINNAMLASILDDVRPLIGQGKVADYIPALACVSGKKLGIAISTVDGSTLALATPTSDSPFNQFPKSSVWLWR